MSNWSSKKSKAHVIPRLSKSPATGYTNPEINKISTLISADDPDFIPEYSSKENEASLIANIPEISIFLPNGSLKVIDCGISIETPPGYKICISSSLSSVFLSLATSENNRLKVSAINFGEKLILQHKQKIGKIWIEPVYFFEWIMKG